MANQAQNGRISIDVDVRPATLTDETYPFKGNELAVFAVNQASHHADRAEYHRARFLAAIMANLPKGMTIDPNEIDIDQIEINTRAGSMTSSHTHQVYSGVVNDEASEAKRSYDAHRHNERRMNRFASLFSREPLRIFALNESEVEMLGVFRE